MLFSTNDLDILRLLRWCRCILADDLTRAFSEAEVQNLHTLRLMTLHKPTGAFVLTAKGNRLLDTAFSDLPPAAPPAYRPADTLRRLRLSKILLTAYRAGINVFAGNISQLSQDGSLFLPSISRGRGINPWGSTRVAAIARLGDTFAAIHYVCPEIGRIALHDELTAFHNNTVQLPALNRAMIFSGQSYKEILAELDLQDDQPGGKLHTYGEAYRSLKLPVYLIPCNETGVLQYRILSVPAHRRKLAQAALKGRYEPPPEHWPWCDALFQGQPFLMAADMDLRRIDMAVEETGDPVILAALPEQAEEVLYPRYRDTGKARVFTLTEGALSQVLGTPPLPGPGPQQVFTTKKGDVIHVPLI